MHGVGGAHNRDPGRQQLHGRQAQHRHHAGVNRRIHHWWDLGLGSRALSLSLRIFICAAMGASWALGWGEHASLPGTDDTFWLHHWSNERSPRPAIISCLPSMMLYHGTKILEPRPSTLSTPDSFNYFTPAFDPAALKWPTLWCLRPYTHRSFVSHFRTVVLATLHIIPYPGICTRWDLPCTLQGCCTGSHLLTSTVWHTTGRQAWST